MASNISEKRGIPLWFAWGVNVNGSEKASVNAGQQLRKGERGA
jgi:hypothetical protein